MKKFKDELYMTPLCNFKGWKNVNFIDAKNYLEKGLIKKPYLLPMFDSFCEELEREYEFTLSRNYFDFKQNNIIEFAIIHTLFSNVNRAYIEKMCYYLFKNKEFEREDYWDEEGIRKVLYFAYSFK